MEEFFIGGKQLWELDSSNKKCLSLQHHKKRISQQLELHENVSLIICSGTIGKATLVPKHWGNWRGNQPINRGILANESIVGYINVFLSSGYGNQLIKRFTYGSVVDDAHVKKNCVSHSQGYKCAERN